MSQSRVPTVTLLFTDTRAPDARPHNLPIQPTPLIGRQAEVESLCGLLLRDDVRLVTLTGPGGIGKTRLALEVATELIDAYSDGVFLVELAPISDPSLVVPTIARTLGVTDTGHPINDLVSFLRERRLLLLLDNFEQVVEAATIVGDLLRACSRLSVLVTSRAPLRLGSEHERPIQPLGVPDVAHPSTPRELGRYGAIALFVERAQAVRPNFALTPSNASAVAGICARLDGLPLAIELAAARTRLLTPEALLPRLERSLDLLTGGRRDLPARQQTLRSAIAWSYDLLSDSERRLFRRLSVFVGGFTLAAAEALCRADRPSGSAAAPAIDVLDGVASLVDHSLVRPQDVAGGEARFAMLETIREFGLERLEASGEETEVRGRHLTWCLELVERAEREMGGPAWTEWVDRLENELDNIRAALGWSVDGGSDPEFGLRIAGILSGLWSMRGYFREGRSWLARLLPRSAARTRARAKALDTAGYLALRQYDYAAASTLLDEALAIRREIGDRHGVVETLRHFSIVLHYRGDFDRARTMLRESLSLSREVDDPYGTRQALRHLADLAYARAEYAEAASTYEQSLTLARQHGDTHEVALALRGLGHLARARGEYTRARQLLHESLNLLGRLRDRRCAPICLEGIACIAVGPDWADRATRLFAAAHALQQATGSPAPPTELADYRRTEADARAHLGEERFASIWEEGAAMSLDEAIAYALAEDETPVTAEMSTATPQSTSPSGGLRESVPLSPREREVVALIAGGLSNREISERLVLSVRTVERHIENIYNRLGISGKAGRAIVTAYALRHRVIPTA